MTRAPASWTVLRQVVATTASGCGSSPEPATPTPIDTSGVVPDDLVRIAVQERLTGPLLWCVAHDLVALDGPALEALETAHVEALAWSLRVESRLWSIVGWLDELGIDPLVLKGPAVAHLDEGDPAMRTFADLDLLVAGDDLGSVLGVLAQRGAIRPYAERRRGFDRRFAKSVTVTFPDLVEIDVHRTICDGVHGVRVPVDRLLAHPDRFELGGRTVLAPDRTVRVLHAAYHAVLGSPSPRLVSLRDLVGYLGTAERDGSLAVVTTEADEWGGRAVLATAVAEVLDLGVALPGWAAWLATVDVAPEEDEIVAAQRRDGSSFGRSRIAAARELPTNRLRAEYLLAATAPSTRHLRSRGRTRADALLPGPPAGKDPVVLPDLPPPSHRPSGTERVLVVRPSFPQAEDAALPGEEDGHVSVHVVVRRGAERLRDRWWRTGRTATVTELPAGEGWVPRVRRMATASGEVRRADPDHVVVDRSFLVLVAPALLTGRRRTVDVVDGPRPVPPRDGARGRLERWVEAAIGRRHRAGAGAAPGLH